MKLAQRIIVGYYRIRFKVITLFSLKEAAKEAFELFCTPYSKRKTYAIPVVFEQAEKIQFDFQQHTIHGFKWKSTISNGRKVLICHGFDSYSYKFERYILPLTEKGFEVLAFDAPAHGLSSGKTINALLYSEMIVEITALYGFFTAIIAHSFGGLAAGLAIEKLCQNRPERLVLIAPATETTRSVTDFGRYLRLSKKLKEALENLIIQIGGKPASWYSVARIVQSIKIPTLWLHDAEDTITPYEDMRHLTKLSLPHVEFIITKGLGHSLYRDDAVASRIIDFVADIE